MKIKFTNLSFETYLLPFLLLLINFILKIIYIGYGDIAGDEPFTIFYSQVDYETFSKMLQTENNPPLFFVLIHFWIKIFGISAISTRFLPLIFSTITVLFIYKTGMKFFNIRIAIISSLLFTFSNYHMYFAHETRVYSLFALLTTISMYAFLSLILDKSKRGYFYLLIISNILLIYSHFFGFFVLFIQFLSIISIKGLRDNLIKKYAFATFVTFILYVPYIKLLLDRFSSSSGGTWVSTPTFESLYNNLWKFSNAPVNTVFFILILLVALIAIIVKRKEIVNNHLVYSKVILIWFLVPYFLMFFISFLIPIFLDRYLVFISIAYYFTIAISINYLSKPKWLFYSLSVLTVSLMLFTFNPKSSNDRKKNELAKTISDLKTENTLVYLCPDWIDLGFVYYYNLDYFKDYKNTRIRLNGDNIFPINSASQINESFILNSESVIYLDGWSALVDSDNLIFEKLNKSFNKVDINESYEAYKIYHFTR
ncbi:MAG: hypothetical protein DRJ05_02800 [Bacteroidetes bacterium]|nr:MAG: hypothetical protein DRJ05_02800 [Bacteroidota bacterium]